MLDMCTAEEMEARLLCRCGSTKLSKYFVGIIRGGWWYWNKGKITIRKSCQIRKNSHELRATGADIHGFSKSWNVKFQEEGQGSKSNKLGRAEDLMATFNERGLNWRTRRRFPATSGINFWVRISKFRKNFDKFPLYTHQDLIDKNSVLHSESYLCAKIEFIQKLYFHGNFWENISQSIVLHCSSGCSRIISSLLCQRFTWSYPCLCALCCVTAVTQEKISCSWVQSVYSTRQVLSVQIETAKHTSAIWNRALWTAKERQE